MPAPRLLASAPLVATGLAVVLMTGVGAVTVRSTTSADGSPYDRSVLLPGGTDPASGAPAPRTGGPASEAPATAPPAAGAPGAPGSPHAPGAASSRPSAGVPRSGARGGSGLQLPRLPTGAVGGLGEAPGGGSVTGGSPGGPAGGSTTVIKKTDTSTEVPDPTPADPPPPADPPTPPVAPPPPSSAWRQVFFDDMGSTSNLVAFQSSPTRNAQARGSDSANSQLQKPTLRSNVSAVQDGSVSAVVARTQRATYTTPSGTTTGWTNGRWALRGQDQSLPVRVTARLRFTPSVLTKSAIMWWPSGGGWPWEVDFAEQFGGARLGDYWSGRQHVGQRWHADLNGDGRALEQLVGDVDLDATRYHEYQLTIMPNHMWVAIDGTPVMETRNAKYLPTGKGFFSVGKALTGQRDATGRTDDAVYVDWVKLEKPG